MRLSRTAFRPLIPLFIVSVAHAGSHAPSVIRWDQGQADCAFEALNDGTYRYALRNGGVVVTLAMDAQELEKSQRRTEDVLGFFLSVRSKQPLSFTPSRITLEFVKHYHTRELTLSPAAWSARIQTRANLEQQKSAEALGKHPEEKEAIQAAASLQTQDVAQMSGWIHSNMLWDVNEPKSDFAGWLVFETKTRWIGRLNQQENFVLRIPLGNVVIEFPFTLPPSRDDFRLRSRPAD